MQTVKQILDNVKASSTDDAQMMQSLSFERMNLKNEQLDKAVTVT